MSSQDGANKVAIDLTGGSSPPWQHPRPSVGAGSAVSSLDRGETSLFGQVALSVSAITEGPALTVDQPPAFVGQKRKAEDEGQTSSKRVRQSRKDCGVCGEDIPVSRYPLNPHPGADLKHGRLFCINCWKKHIGQRNDDGNYDNVECLHGDCDVVLQVHEIRKLLGKTGFNEYENNASQATIEGTEGFVHCQAPNCDWACFMSIKPGDANIMTCQKCFQKFCTDCKALWHGGLTCEQYKRQLEQQRQDEVANENTIRATTKECPKCKVRIEKSSGCDHMTCKKCRYEFCWVCSVSYHGRHGVDGWQQRSRSLMSMALEQYQCQSYDALWSMSISAAQRGP